jgi:D-sedoheptulose 7-phosphate isomerase
VQVSESLQTKLIAREYVARFVALVERADLAAVERVVEQLRIARDDGAMVYLAGNGGSAATATHWTNDLAKATKRSGRAPMRALCLSDNTSWLTALGNDEGYERVFAGQLENFARAGDVLIVLSASGNSPNLMRAVELAKDRGLVTVGLLGFDGGALKDMVTECIWLETEIGAYGLVETGHVLLADIITDCFIRDCVRGTDAPSA